MNFVGDVLAQFKELPEPGSTPPVLTLTEKNGFVRQADRFHKRVATEDTSKYKVVRKNDIAFNPYLLWAGAVAQNTIVDEGVISPLYPTFRVRDGYDPRYVARLLLTPAMIAAYDTIAFGSVPRRRRSSTDDFLNLQIPTLPGLNEQRRIATILDHTDNLRTKRRAVRNCLNQLAKSLFETAFGAALRDANATLDELADVSSGITKGRRTSEPTRPIPYLAVANVQSGHLDLTRVKEIDVTETEIKRYALQGGDLVLTEGGDPDKLGRGTVWRNELPLCLHQNHIFRVRVTTDQLEPDYLSAYLASKPAKAYFLRAAKQTTGIASINMKQLRNTPIYLPPLAEQHEYLHRVREVAVLQSCAESHATELGELFASLESSAYSGRL